MEIALESQVNKLYETNKGKKEIEMLIFYYGEVK